MTIKEVDKAVQSFCDNLGLHFERDPITHEYKFTRTIKSHLSNGIKDNKRAYDKQSVESRLDKVREFFQ